MTMFMGRRRLAAVGGALCLALLGGCFGKPNQANIQLRKDKQGLQEQVEQLIKDRDAARARIAGLETRSTTAPTLPQDRLDCMFTAYGISVGRLTSIDEAGRLKVYVVPVDESGDPVKATGRYVIEAFDLALPTEQRVGRWEFSAAQAKANWYERFLHSFVFTCPIQHPPAHPQITVKVSFDDELTGRVFSEQRVVSVPPPTTAPASRPARAATAP